VLFDFPFGWVQRFGDCLQFMIFFEFIRSVRRDSLGFVFTGHDRKWTCFPPDGFPNGAVSAVSWFVEYAARIYCLPVGLSVLLAIRC